MADPWVELMLSFFAAFNRWRSGGFVTDHTATLSSFIQANSAGRIGRHPTGAHLLPARDRTPNTGSAYGVALNGPVVGPIPRLAAPEDRLFLITPGTNRKERRRRAKEMRRAA